jgi:hypothetical protein
MTNLISDSAALGYATTAQIYWDKGWSGVLPLKRGAKWPPPKGFTGYDGADPSYADVLEWGELYSDGNLCLRLPDGVVGVDVDAYGAKTGGAAFAEAVKRWGPLPDGPQSSSRDNDLVSGLRLFRVPPNTLLETVIVFPEMSIGDIEIIQRHHRYVVCWPSVHPEGRDYWWRNSAGQILGVPDLDDIPWLPQPWIDGLKLTPKSLDVSAEFDTRRALTAGEPSQLVQARLAQAIKEMNLPGMSRHDTCLRHVMAILRLGAEGQPGVEQALSLLREVFVAVLADPSRGDVRPRDIAFSEFNRMVSNGNVARELSQPGILDWFRQILKDGGDPVAQFANAERADSAEAAAVSGDDTAPPERPSGELERIEQDFWSAREAHRIIYEAALSRMGAPWAVFAACVARVLALVPPMMTLPPIIGGRGSLNWFGVVVAESGGGKGTAMSVASDLVTGNVDVRPIGSGEGMVECYDRRGDDPQQYVTSVMFDVPEIDTIGAMGDRSGQTTTVVLRNGFSGERLGFTYRGRTTAPVEAHTYRMTLLVGAQPSRAGALLEDGGGGTVQRLMWFPGMDRRVVADQTPYPVDGLGMNRTLNGLFPRRAELLSAAPSISVPPEVVTEIREARAAFMRKEVDETRGHILFAQEKVAFALAYMDGRTEIDLEDWRLAKLVTAVSDWTLRRVAESYQESRLNEFRDRGVLKGAENAAAERSKANEQVTAAERVLRNIIKRVEKAGPGGVYNTDLIQAIHSRDRPLVRGALDYAASQGLLVMDETTKMWVKPS